MAAEWLVASQATKAVYVYRYTPVCQSLHSLPTQHWREARQAAGSEGTRAGTHGCF